MTEFSVVDGARCRVRKIPLRWRKLLAVLAGIVLSAGPALGLHFGIKKYIEREGQQLVDSSVQRAISKAEWRMDQVLVGISELSSTVIASCSDVDLGELRRAVISITPVKELAIVGADGSPRCTHLGLGGRAWTLSREMPIADDPNVLLSVVRMPDRNQRALRVRWQRPSEPLSLSALIPADMLMSEIETKSESDDTGLRISLTDGTLIAGSGGFSETGGQGRIYAHSTSDRYPLEATASISYAAIWTAHRDLVAMGAAGSVLFALMIIAFLLLAPWRARRDPIAAIERALEAGEFVPYLQPIIDLKTGRLIGAEVLVRWRKPDGTIVSPRSFIPLMESTALIIELTRHLMRAVRDQVGASIGHHPHVRVGFNLDSLHFVDDQIAKDVVEIFGKSPMSLNQIVLEVTERQPLKSLTSARRVIAGLQEIGCKVAIDDVGTGHAGLSYILKLGVDIIKIDKIFVDAIGNERHSTVIIDTLVDLCRTMNLTVVAEGVETFEQVKVLREHGVRLAQGHVFAPPLPAKSFAALLDAVDPKRAVSVERPAA